MAVRNRLMTVVVEPMAARAFSPATFPTINASAQL
ncbi:unknown [Anaerostipes sp. CAG:276]|nr:unknown [Anaerostipes sp. CAG:276]